MVRISVFNFGALLYLYRLPSVSYELAQRSYTSASDRLDQETAIGNERRPLDREVAVAQVCTIVGLTHCRWQVCMTVVLTQKRVQVDARGCVVS